MERKAHSSGVKAEWDVQGLVVEWEVRCPGEKEEWDQVHVQVKAEREAHSMAKAERHLVPVEAKAEREVGWAKAGEDQEVVRVKARRAYAPFLPPAQERAPSKGETGQRRPPQSSLVLHRRSLHRCQRH